MVQYIVIIQRVIQKNPRLTQMAISQPFNAPNYNRASEATVDDVSDIQRIINAIEMRDFKSLILHYQPQYHSKTLDLVGFEALARFKHVAGNITEPNSFIPALSDSNLLTDFDTAVMLAVLRSISVFQKIYGDKTTLSINVSQNSVCMPEFRNRLFKAIKKHQINPQCIFLEITETERLITSISQLTLSIEELVNHGVRVSLDDFGTGYSTIEQLALLPISEIKIDQQFIQSTNTENSKRYF
ncbi:MAG: hypothetical protein CL693_00895 [Cellvibrionaceae bacterium]|nr:hypothetical protein [Cellvibrionaceae bacterium]|tara:strand:+ start:185 stop:910 length:726 start_codon:yes stop_codon:yes gene_type:complete